MFEYVKEETIVFQIDDNEAFAKFEIYSQFGKKLESRNI
jgi:hypothetical protein